AQATLALLKEGSRSEEVQAAKAKLDRQNASFRLAEKEFQRARALRERAAISQQELDIAHERYEGAQALVQESAAILAQFEEGSRKQEVARAQALVEASASSLRAIDEEMKELTIVAPISGIVHAIDLVEGDLIAAKAPVVTIIDLSSLWIRTYIQESRLSYAIGQEVQVLCDSYPDRPITGRIAFISSEAEFTPGNIQTTEDRSLQVYRVKVRSLQPDQGLRPGTYCDVNFGESSES
ncbi:MAG: HlyD family efflux transporter periplasmic adaptor subunit, partial [Bdellovibrionales bacterium]|nr:HlyD family efflux transporter periplasmic adaptor subunit [Bdellovibrionales bacterium]